MLRKSVVTVCALLLFACRSAEPRLEHSSSDASATAPVGEPAADGGAAAGELVPLVDAGPADSGTLGVIDAGIADAGAPGVVIADAGAGDAGLVDAGSFDAGAPDPGAADAGARDAGTADAGSAQLPPISPGLMPATASGWSPFSARPQSAPALTTSSGSSGYILDVAGQGVASVYGGFTAHINRLQGSAWYRFQAHAVPHGIDSLRKSVTIVLRWSGAFGEEVSPDYIWDYQPQADGSMLFDRAIQAPAGTTAVDVQLALQWSPNGGVAFDRLGFTPQTAPPSRKVRVAAIYARPSGAQSGYQAVQQAGQYAQQVAATSHPDVIVMGELLNTVGFAGTLDSEAETIPGPSSDYLASIARSYQVNIVFGMVEKAGNLLFNAAVLIDRNGTIIGKHHKVQLPLAEASSGISPGSAVEVFDTDFGKVALLICQETSFPEPAREAALKGAEMLLVPIWGGRQTLVHARAMENGLYLAASGYDYSSEVVDPLGNVLASAAIGGAPTVALADIDLGKRFREDWLGDWRDISNKERWTAPYGYQLP